MDIKNITKIIFDKILSKFLNDKLISFILKRNKLSKTELANILLEGSDIKNDYNNISNSLIRKGLAEDPMQSNIGDNNILYRVFSYSNTIYNLILEQELSEPNFMKRRSTVLKYIKSNLPNLEKAEANLLLEITLQNSKLSKESI